MELHSYAKLRASKKWNIEQKRKLVEARINYDSWFNSKPSNSVVPWKKVLSVAKLDDFNVFFVRKQWSNMLTKYKLYKQTRLDGIGGINKSVDSDIIQRINQEWEFFEAIHTFMTRKTTNLHSYAVTQKFLNNTISTATTTDNSLVEANNSNSIGISINNTIANINDASNMILGDNANDELTATASSVFKLSRTSLGESERKSQHQQQIVIVKNENRMDATANVKLERDCIKENIPNNNNNNNMTILLQVTADGTATPKLEDIQQQNYHPHNHHHNHHQQHHMFSSDTNEEFEVICETDIPNEIMLGCQHHSRNTDHDCYSKRMAAEAAAAAAASVCKFPLEKHEEMEEEQRQLHYFADTSEESMGTEYVYQTTTTTSSSSSSSASTTTVTSQNVSLPSVMENIELHTEDGRTFEIKTENISTTSNGGGKQDGILLKEIRTKKDNKSIMPGTSSQTNMTNNATVPTTYHSKMSERDKYYRHKRRFNRRLEKRFDAILGVMGQVVKSQYPSVDIQPLMAVIDSTSATGLSGLLNTSSDDDSEEDADGKKNQTSNI